MCLFNMFNLILLISFFFCSAPILPTQKHTNLTPNQTPTISIPNPNFACKLFACVCVCGVRVPSPVVCDLCRVCVCVRSSLFDTGTQILSEVP